MRFRIPNARKVKLVFGAMLPHRIWNFLFPGQTKPKRIFQELAHIPFIIEEIDRTKALDREPWLPHRRPLPEQLPMIDISIVTFNSRDWLSSFFSSLLNQNYPTRNISLLITDNDSRDDTLSQLKTYQDQLKSVFGGFSLFSQPNFGFGCGHNHNLKYASAQYFLVANIDIVWESDTLGLCVASAMSDDSDVAAWECRQKPYEQDKYYDYQTLETAWVSAGCVLFRRRAINDIRGFDPSIFLYCEDVEISYRLRSYGWRLKYLPWAVVWHFSYDRPGKVKPLQYSGSIFGNMYLRLKYGTLRQIISIPALVFHQLCVSQPVRSHRRIILGQCIRNLNLVTKSLGDRTAHKKKFGFSGWEFELTRAGRFYPAHPRLASLPPVAIILRNRRDDMHWLRPALYALMNQTYTDFFIVLISEINENTIDVVKEVQNQIGRDILRLRIENPKTGKELHSILTQKDHFEFIQLMDVVQSCFADHLEVLVQTLIDNPKHHTARAKYWAFNTRIINANPLRYIERLDNSHSKRAGCVSPATPAPFNRIPCCSAMFRREAWGNDMEKILASFLADRENSLKINHEKLRCAEPIEKTTSIHRTITSTHHNMRV